MSDDRRDFLKQGMVAAAGLVAMPLAASTDPGQAVPLTKPVAVKVTENSETKDGDRTETQAKFDLVGGNGAIHRITGYTLKIERADSYDTTVVLKTDKFRAANDSKPADSDLRIIIVSGDKGAVEGDYRTDEVEVTVFGPEGVTKARPQIVKKSLIDPYAGLSVDEKAQAIIDQRVGNPGK